ncbi:MAG: Rossmann-like domain-containing protein, partial [Anaerolineales bacterium]
DDLLDSITLDAPVRSVLVGAHWTAVCSRHCGLASTLLGDQPHGHEKVRDVGSLHHKSARELAEFAKSDNLLEASIGVAAMNSLLDVDIDQAVEVNAGQVLADRGTGKKIALVGHFPFIPKLRQVASQLWVIEQRPAEGEYPVEAAADLIPQAEIVALTGSAIINHTLDNLLELCHPDALVVVLGPSTPLSRLLFDYGVRILSGARVINETDALKTISQGATFQQVQGVKLLTYVNSKEKR